MCIMIDAHHKAQLLLLRLLMYIVRSPAGIIMNGVLGRREEAETKSVRSKSIRVWRVVGGRESAVTVAVREKERTASAY